MNGSAIDGPGGIVDINAHQNITTGDIITRSENQQAGNISLNSDLGRIVSGTLDSRSGTGFPDGLITLQAPQGITTGPVLSDNIQIIGPSVSSSLGLQLNRLASNQPTVNQTSTPIAAVETPAPTPAPIFTETAPEVAPAPENPATPVEPISDNSSSTTPPVSPGSDNRENTTPQAPAQIPNLNLPVMSGKIPPGTAEDTILNIEQERTGEYAEHFRRQLPNIKNFSQIRDMLGKISEDTNLKPAMIYVVEDQQGMWAVMVTADTTNPSIATIAGDQTVTEKEGQPWIITTNKLADLKQKLYAFRDSVSKNEAKSIVLADGHKLYDLLIKPLEAKLQADGINTLIFSMPESMRLLPVAALHDGQQFLVEKYKIAQIPSVSLMDTTYNGVQDGELLAMGISDFKKLANVKQLEDLKGVNETMDGIKLSWPGAQIYLNEQATLANLAEARQSQRFNIIHISTHAAFQNKDNNYIQFWDGQKHLEDLRQVQWYGDRSVELLVLSACETAVGNRDAEMGFAGLSVQAGVKTAIATLWKVSDGGTSELMARLYQNLGQFPTKVEALQQAQIAMLRGEVKPKQADLDFTHPYYWAPFTLIGTPW